MTKDDENLAKIIGAAESTKSLSAVVLVINGSVARSTVNIRNGLTLLRGAMPDVILKNIIVVLTNCTETSYNFNTESLKPWTVVKENLFFMQNSVLSRDPSEWRNNSRQNSACWTSGESRWAK